MLRQAGVRLDRLRDSLRTLPPKPYTTAKNGGQGEYAHRLLREIGDLAERAVVVEREARERARQGWPVDRGRV